MQDPLTITAIDGYGFGARAGSVIVGFGAYGEIAGIRDGVVFRRDVVRSHDISLPFVGTREVLPFDACHAARGKDYRGFCFFGIWADGHPMEPYSSWNPIPDPTTRLGQLEVDLAVGYGLRLGINPLEVLDAFLGFLWIDLLEDDLHRTWSRRASLRFVGVDGRPLDGVEVLLGEQRIRSDRRGLALAREPLAGAMPWFLVRRHRQDLDIPVGSTLAPLPIRTDSYPTGNVEQAGILHPGQHEVMVQLSDWPERSILMIGP